MEFWMSNIQNDHLRSSKLSFAIDNLSSVVKLPTYHTPRVFWPTRCDKALSEVPCPNPRSETGAMSRCYDGWHRPSPIPATEAPHLKPGEEHKATTINDDQRRSTTNCLRQMCLCGLRRSCWWSLCEQQEVVFTYHWRCAEQNRSL